MLSYDAIVEKIEEGNKLHTAGMNKEALDIYFSLWDALEGESENIYEIDELRWLIRCIYNVYFSQHDYMSARKWVEKVFNCNIPERATSEIINLGRVYFELGMEKEAIEQFEKAYKKGKKRAFQGVDEKYLNFYLTHRK